MKLSFFKSVLYVPGLFFDLILIPLIPFLLLYNIYTRCICKTLCITDYYPRNSKETIVFLIHGSGFNSSEFLLYRYLLYLLNYKYVCILDYDGIISNQKYSSISDYAIKLEECISTNCKKYNCKECILIGHSMGGLISSYYAENIYKYSNNNFKISKILTLGTPWNGSEWIKLLNKTETRYSEINDSNFFMDFLKSKIQYSNSQYYNFYGPYDFFIFRDSKLYNGQNYRYAAAGHYSILFFAIYDCIQILK